MLDGLAAPAASRWARRAGALGQIHVSPYEHIHEMCISPVWGSPSHETLELLPNTVVCSIDNADGEYVKRLIAKGEATATLHATVDTGWRKTPILIAELPAKGGTNEPFVLLSGHQDTWHYGVMDNGSANATMLEVARLCAKGNAKVGAVACVSYSGRATLMAVIPDRPGMSTRIGERSSGVALRTSTSIPLAVRAIRSGGCAGSRGAAQSGA